MFLAAGSDDKTVDPGNTTRLAARLRANHDNVEVHMYPGIGHATLMGAFAPALTLLAPVRDDVLHFIDNHTQHSGAGG
jgi:dipeptidyl aminopeptidase/acylaminoacyl peptidase